MMPIKLSIGNFEPKSTGYLGKKTSLKISLLCLLCMQYMLLIGHADACAHHGLLTEYVEIVKEGLSSQNETMRLDSIQNVESMNIADPDIENILLKISSHDKSEVVRAAALFAVGNLNRSVDIAIFRRALKARGRQAYLVHISAAAVLYNRGDKDALNVILRYLDSKNNAAAIEAGMCAGKLHNGDIIQLLRARLNTSKLLLKNTLLESLVRLGGKITEKEINSLLESEQVAMQWTALKIIGFSRDTRFNRKLYEKLDNDNPITRIRAAKLLTILGRENKKSIIIEYLLSNKNDYAGISGEDVRAVALTEGISEIGDISDMPMLEKLLKKSGRDRIMAAGAAIAILNRQNKTEQHGAAKQ